MMPIMNGWEVAEALASNSIFSDIPIIIISAFHEKAKGIMYKEILKKPVNLDLLLSLVRRYCTQKITSSSPT
jgi:CheY-like chemotaxis protein